MSTSVEGCSVLWGYHEYIRGCSVHRGNTMSTSGDIMSTSGDIMSASGDVQYIGVSNRN